MMKRKVTVVGIDGKVHEEEIAIRDYKLAMVRQTMRASTFKNKKAYTRKEKYKNNFENY